MKDLSLAKPLVIVMVGLPGAGKSFFARQFPVTFGAALVSYDRLGFELFKQTPTSRNQQHIVERIADIQIEELLKTKRTFIIDGGHNNKTARRDIRDYAHKAGYGMLIIWVQTENGACRQRSLKRSDKKDGDIYNSSLSSDAYDNLVKSFQAPRPEETYLVISGKHTYATQARTILRKLASPKEEPAVAKEVSPTPAAVRTIESPQAPARSLQPRRRSVTIN